jgi:hypothetical protein
MNSSIVYLTTPIICKSNETIELFQDVLTFFLILVITGGMIYFVATRLIPDTFLEGADDSSTVSFIRSIVGFYVLVILFIELVSLITGTDYGCLSPKLPPEFNVLFQIITLL